MPRAAGKGSELIRWRVLLWSFYGKKAWSGDMGSGLPPLARCLSSLLCITAGFAQAGTVSVMCYARECVRVKKYLRHRCNCQDACWHAWGWNGMAGQKRGRQGGCRAICAGGVNKRISMDVRGAQARSPARPLPTLRRYTKSMLRTDVTVGVRGSLYLVNCQMQCSSSVCPEGVAEAGVIR